MGNRTLGLWFGIQGLISGVWGLELRF